MQNKLMYSLIVVAIVIVFVYSSYFPKVHLVSKEGIYEDAILTQKINTDWNLVEQSTGHLSVLLFYSDDLEDHTYSIYVDSHNNGKYNFKSGGNLTQISNHVSRIQIEGYIETIFMSLNKEQVSKITVEYGDNIEDIFIDYNKPFIFILEKQASKITFLNLHNEFIKSYNF